MENVVRQGFICPFCMEDFGDFTRLQEHVDIEHGEEESVDLADTVVQNVKGFFDKAKRGIKKLDAKINIGEMSNVNISNVQSEIATAAEKIAERAPKPRVLRPLPPDVIPMGKTRSHTSDFRKFRDESINETSIRTNMLIIRLDRLINGAPKDPVKLREFEREIVPWLEDSDVICCPLCAARFGLTRRRHHCRLCGRVLCHNCSQFLSYLSARKLTNPDVAHKMLEAAASVTQLASMSSSSEDTSPSNSRKKLFSSITQQSMDKMRNLIGGAVNKVNGTTNEDGASVSSLLQQDASECMRVCGSCLNDLRRRENMMDHGKAAAVVEQYEHLRNLMAELKQLVPTYVRLATSIGNGETMYTLKSAEGMRQNCLEKQKYVDSLSKKIAEGYDSDTICLREQQMRRNIRATTLQVLQGLVGQMTSLPTPDEYQILVKKHKEDVARQVAISRERSMLASDRILKASSSMPVLGNRNHSSSPAHSRKSPQTVVEDDGWTPQSSKGFNPFLEEESLDNPLMVQREQIRGFLSQAASAGKLDEVEMLERSLKEIEEEIRLMGFDPK